MSEECTEISVLDKQCEYICINSYTSTKTKWALSSMGALGTHSNSANVTYVPFLL